MMHNYKKKLSNLHVPMLPDYIEWVSPLAVKIVIDEIRGLSLKSSIGGFYKAIKSALFSRTEYRCKLNDESKLLFFYGKWNYREDHFKIFNNFTKSFTDFDNLYAFKVKPYFNGFSFIFDICKIVIWSVYLIFKGFNIFQVGNTIPYILEADKIVHLYKKWNVAKYTTLVTYYDVSPDENILVQICNHNKIITCTMQHGIFAKKDNVIKIPDSGLELLYSRSNYYLAWNQYTKEQAMKLGREEVSIKVLGIPRYINFNRKNHVKNKSNKVFGVILNNSEFDLHNKKLLEIATKIANIFKYKYVVRFHPELKYNMYSNYLNNSYYMGPSDNTNSISIYVDDVDFTIITSSSLYVDLLLLEHRVFRYIVSENDTYSEITHNSFNNISQFNELFSSSKINNIDNSYLCGPNNIYEQYNNFFESLISQENVHEDVK